VLNQSKYTWNAELARKQRERRKLSGNKTTFKYEKTINGFLMRLYRNMQSRVTGVQHKKAHLYQGKELLPRQEFYNWANNSIKFLDLFNKWTALGYPRTETPSVDRIDSSKGYTLDNMQWLTHSENSAKSAREACKKP